jgi:hypothetical protein
MIAIRSANDDQSLDQAERCHDPTRNERASFSFIWLISKRGNCELARGEPGSSIV